MFLMISIEFQLSPTDRSLQTGWEQEIDDAKEYVRKLNVISTNKDKEMEVEDEKDDFEVCGFSLVEKKNLWQKQIEKLNGQLIIAG